MKKKRTTKQCCEHNFNVTSIVLLSMSVSDGGKLSILL